MPLPLPAIAAAMFAFMLMPLVSATPARAGGDGAKGESVFRKCRACHMIKAEDGTMIVKGSAHGPNLFGVIGREIGSVDGYRYSKGLAALRDKDMVWTEALLAEFVADPSAFVSKYNGKRAMRSKMSLRLSRGGEDVAAYLARFGAHPEN